MDLLSIFTDLGSFWPFLGEKLFACGMLLTVVTTVFSSENLEIYHLTLPLYVTSQRNHMKYDSISCGSNKEQSNDNK